MPEAVVAISGASGALYAERLVRALSDAKWEAVSYTHLTLPTIYSV